MSKIFNNIDLQEAYTNQNEMNFYSDEEKTAFSADIKTLEALFRDNLNNNYEYILNLTELLIWDNSTGKILYKKEEYKKNLIETPWAVRKMAYEHNSLGNFLRKISDILSGE